MSSALWHFFWNADWSQPGETGTGIAPFGNAVGVPRVKTLLYQISTAPVFVPVVEGEITLDKWYWPLAEPKRFKPRPTEFLYEVRDPKDPPLGVLPTVEDTGTVFFKTVIYPELVEPLLRIPVDKLEMVLPLSEPVRLRVTAHHRAALLSSGPIINPLFVIPLDKLEIVVPLSEPLRLKVTPHHRAAGISSGPITPLREYPGTGFAPFGQDVGVPRFRTLLYQVSTAPIFVPVPEQVNVDKWFRALDEPKRFPRTLTTGAQQFLAFHPNPYVSFGWWAMLEQPYDPQKPGHRVEYQEAGIWTAIEIVQPSDPLRPLFIRQGSDGRRASYWKGRPN